ncbi:MAG: ABC transporter permease [Beijerinckiaceae bacterium]
MVNRLWRYTPLLLLAALWEIATQLEWVSDLSLPKFSDVLKELAGLAGSDLAFQTWKSLYRGFSGLAAAIVVGIAAGLLMARYRPVRLLLNPLMQMLYPMPKSALIPLTIMWIGLGDASKITLIFIGCLLPVVVSAYNAARGVDEILLWSARGLGAGEGELLREVILPAALPEILNGVRTALALSFILVVAGELIIANNGIGYLIDLLGEDGQLAPMFAAIMVVAAIGFAADRVFQMLSRRLLRWQEAAV